FDILDVFSSIKVCTAYKVGSTTYNRPPSNLALFEKCQPIYEELPGWQTPTSDIRSFKKLPKQAQAYVKKLEQLIGCPVSIISIGPAREQTIVVKPVL
ncbi:MAG: adenylosuccinate synthase, partial [Chloroflexi bacterium]|nr:adenylosuccinate synthase [Chloroflexota bacterium]